MNRGDICWYTFTAPDKKRPVLVLTRDSAIPVFHSVTIAPITSTIRSIPTEVVLTEEDGLPATCAANFENLQAIPKRNIGDRIARFFVDADEGSGDGVRSRVRLRLNQHPCTIRQPSRLQCGPDAVDFSCLLVYLALALKIEQRAMQ